MDRPSMSTQIIYLLTYVLTTASWMQQAIAGLQLGQLQFRLHYRAGKANIDANALSLVSWPGCIPGNTSTCVKVTAAAMQGV